jgi:hypothetical protein
MMEGLRMSVDDIRRATKAAKEIARLLGEIHEATAVLPRPALKTAERPAAVRKLTSALNELLRGREKWQDAIQSPQLWLHRAFEKLNPGEPGSLNVHAGALRDLNYHFDTIRGLMGLEQLPTSLSNKDVDASFDTIATRFRTYSYRFGDPWRWAQDAEREGKEAEQQAAAPKTELPTEKPLSDTKKDILKLVRNQALKSAAIAKRIGLSPDYTRALLSELVTDGHLKNDSKGYRKARK